MVLYYGGSHQEPRKSFRALVADQIVACLVSATASQAEEKRGSNVLVVDDFALGVLNAAVSQDELFKAGFMTVCPFETKKQLSAGMRRRKYPSLDVLYFMRPKKSNLQKIIDDYRQDVVVNNPDLFEKLFPCIFRGVPDIEPEPPMYADCRMLVLPGLPQRTGAANWQLAEEFLFNLAETRGGELARLRSSLQTDSPVKECPVEFMAYESSLFSLDMPDTLSTVYTHPLSGGVLEGAELEDLRDKVFDHLDTVANRLMTACVCLNEAPHVRYTHSSRGIAEVVARSLVKQLKAYKESHPGFRPVGDKSSAGDEEGRGGRGVRTNEPLEGATVIVVDRVDDLAPLLMHDVSYEGLVVDLLDHTPASPFHYSFKKAGTVIEKDVLLDESDPVWRHLRHEDMGAVIDTVDEGVRAANARADRRKELDPHDVNDLRELMGALTGDEKIVDDKFAQHYRMKNNIVELFERRACHETVTFEQVLVTGCDSEGVHVPSKKAESMLKELLKNDRLTLDDHTRLLALYTLSAKSLDAKTRAELLGLSKLGKASARTLANMADLHVPLTRPPSEPRPDSAPFADDDTLKRNKKLATESRRLCRYVTKLEDILKNVIEGGLPEDAYPWVKPPPKRGELPAASLDAKSLTTSMAMHGAHGEVVNKYTAAAMAAGYADTTGVKSKATKKSKFAKADGETVGPGAGGGAGAGGGDAGKGEVDPLAKFMEPIRPRYYTGGRIIVFVVGGVSLLEVAALSKLSRDTGREIIVGSTSIMTAKDLLEQLDMTDVGGGEEESFGGGAGMGPDLPAFDDF